MGEFSRTISRQSSFHHFSDFWSHFLTVGHTVLQRAHLGALWQLCFPWSCLSLTRSLSLSLQVSLSLPDFCLSLSPSPFFFSHLYLSRSLMPHFLYVCPIYVCFRSLSLFLNISRSDAESYMVGAIASILAGSVWGDHWYALIRSLTHSLFRLWSIY